MSEERFTPAAKERWASIPQPVQFRLLQNVFCAACGRARGMLDARGRVEGGLLVLEGVCGTCGGPVTRVVD